MPPYAQDLADPSSFVTIRECDEAEERIKSMITQARLNGWTQLEKEWEEYRLAIGERRLQIATRGIKLKPTQRDKKI